MHPVDPASSEDHPSTFSPPPKTTPADRQNRVDLVGFYFCQGKSIPQIVKLLERDHGFADLSRELPYHDLAYATNANWLTYQPPLHSGWSSELLTRFPFLLEAHIPKDGERMAVIAESARQIARSINHISVKLAQEYAASWTFPERPCRSSIPRRRAGYDHSDDSCPDDERQGTSRSRPTEPDDPTDPDPLPLIIEIRIGISGGQTMGETIAELGRVLVHGVEGAGPAGHGIEVQERYLKDIVGSVVHKPDSCAPKPGSLGWRRFRVELRLLFINLVAGFHVDPFTHPIAHVTAMINSHELLESRVKMKCFCGSPFVRIGESSEIENLPESPAQVKRFVEKYGLDIILTSAGSLDDPHSALNLYYKQESQRTTLDERGVAGDFMWIPIKATAPFDFEKDLSDSDRDTLRYRPATLLTLDEVVAHVKRGHDVVLIMSPCRGCYQPKDRILKAILDHQNPLITHLIADRRTVAHVLGKQAI